MQLHTHDERQEPTTPLEHSGKACTGWITCVHGSSFVGPIVGGAPLPPPIPCTAGKAPGLLRPLQLVLPELVQYPGSGCLKGACSTWCSGECKAHAQHHQHALHLDLGTTAPSFLGLQTLE